MGMPTPPTPHPPKPTRVGIEQRDDDRHVRAAYGRGKVRAEHARHQRRRGERRRRGGQVAGVAAEKGCARRQRRRRKPRVDEVLAGKCERRRGDEALQLAEGDDRPGQRDGADDVAQVSGHAVHPVERLA
eukprot:360203-Chlamydomonas_euryale.AAC.4